MARARIFSGKWALVTGASAGIGTALARELASHGAKLILTARRRGRLEELAAELRAKGTEVRVVPANLNDATGPQQIWDAVESQGIEVDILIDNAGLGQFGAFHTNPVTRELNQVRVNCEAMVRLTRLIIPGMVERGRGWVLVVSSMASFVPMPYFATYAATKAFDRFFALGLAAEVERYGVKVTALCPGSTESEFSYVARSGALERPGHVQSAEEVARKAIRALAWGRRTIIPYWGGRFISVLVRFLPTRLITHYIEKGSRPPQAL